MATVRDFIYQAYRLVNAHNPTVPLHGDDQKLGIQVLNQLLNSYASTGLLITIAKEIEIPIVANTEFITCGPSTYLPTPDITLGRLANMENAWLELNGVTYPLIDKSRSVFYSSYKYDPLAALPRFIIVLQETEITTLRIYPKPSQAYNFNLRGKFQLSELTSNSNMNLVPMYFQRFLLFATAKDIAMYTGRSEAWTQVLDQMLEDERLKIESASEVNTSIAGDNAGLLNGAWILRAGVGI